MKILMLTIGSRGDVQPFASLAKELQASGHDPLLWAPPSSSLLAESHNVRFAPIKALQSEEVERLRGNTQQAQGMRKRIHARRDRRLVHSRILDELSEFNDGSFDVLVYHFFIPGHCIASKLGIPSVMVTLMPCLVPTNAFPNFWLPVSLPRALNRTTYLHTRFFPSAAINSTRKWRKSISRTAAWRGYRGILHCGKKVPDGVLQGISKHVIPEVSDYPRSVHTTGFWFLPSSKAWKPPRGLVEFLTKSDVPPVYIGFGSIIGINPNRSARIVSSALTLARLRAVVVAGGGGISAEQLGNESFFIDDVPFDWLFERVSAVVHHGGIGVAAAALASGQPQVVCPPKKPYGANFCAARMALCGVAPAPLAQSKLSPELLARSMLHATNDQMIALQAKEMKRKVLSENGVARAVDIIESISRGSGHAGGTGV